MLEKNEQRWAAGELYSPAAQRCANIQVWVVQLDAHDAEQLKQWLSDDERRRAERLLLPLLRRRFVIGRGMLRQILGATLNLSPAALRFRYGPQGKPALDERQSQGLCFNLAHAEGCALYALAWNRSLGVDVEQLRALPDAAALAARFFAPEEQALLQALPPAERVKGFFGIWTRKEAVLKAQGTGIGGGLSHTVVTLDAAPRPVQVGSERGPSTYSVAPLDLSALAPGYLAALAAPGPWEVLLGPWP